MNISKRFLMLVLALSVFVSLSYGYPTQGKKYYQYSAISVSGWKIDKDAKLPVPVIVEILDDRGIVLSSVSTWAQLAPGEDNKWCYVATIPAPIGGWLSSGSDDGILTIQVNSEYNFPSTYIQIMR